jgi:8-oxo-dGTP pyrophosphatase MutT (NUDIX family)
MSHYAHYIKVRHRLTSRLPTLDRLPIEPDRIPQAAVTLLIRELADDDELLIIRRAERNGDPWSGHLALPGGRADRGDLDLLATAARETLEEVGVDLLGPTSSRERFIGRLPSLSPVSPGIPPIEITPLVAIAPPSAQLIINEEVRETWWLSINQLLREGRSCEHRMRHGDHNLKWPAYPSPGGPIWGITERILTHFLLLLN